MRRNKAYTGYMGPLSKRSIEGTPKRMTHEDRRAHEAEVAELTEAWLLEGNEITVYPSPDYYTSTKAAGIPHGSSLVIN